MQYNLLPLEQPPSRKRRRGRDVDDDIEISTEYERYTRVKLTMQDVTIKNPLQWWWNHRSEFPILSKMAFDILSIPSMSAELERCFSQAKNLITDERNQLGEASVTAFECLKQWQIVGIASDVSRRGLTVEAQQEEDNSRRQLSAMGAKRDGFDELYDISDG